MRICLFLLQALSMAFEYSNMDVERGSIETPRLGTDVNVTCGGKEIMVQVSALYIRRNSKWLDGGSFLSLSDNECVGESLPNGNVAIKVTNDFTKCKMFVEEVWGENEESGESYVTDYKFTNHLIHDAAGENAHIAREIDLLQFSCEYPTEQITSDFMQPWIKSQAFSSKVKKLQGDMRLFKNENFTDFYTEPPELSLEDILYVEVNLERPLVSSIATENQNIVVVMDRCWGTPVADRENDMRYYLIQDACPVTGDPSMKVRSNGISLKAKFEVKMFKFIGDDLNDVWLHCTVRACNGTATDSCQPDCENRRRRAAGSEEQVEKRLPYISLEHEILADLPIQRKRNVEEVEILERVIITQGNITVLTPGTISFTVMVCVVALVVLLAIVFGITCLAVQRRRRTMKALTESNFSFTNSSFVN